MWGQGVLSWKLRPEQKKLRNLLEQTPTELAVFNISRRFGKSTTCALFCVEQALKKSQNIRYATAFLTDLENFINPIFEWVLIDCPASLRPIWKSTKKEYHFQNGSVIKLIGLDKNANALRGNNIDILVIDEAGFVSKLEYLYKSVIIPATMKRKFKLIFPSTPPESPEHFWAAELVPKAKEKNSYIELTIDDISDLPAAERQRLLDEVGGEFSATAQREFFCKIMVDANRSICSTFRPDIHIQKSLPGYPIKWMLFGDAGGIRDKSVFLEVGYEHEAGLIIFKSELYFNPGTPTSTIIEQVKDKYPGLTLTLDAPGQLLIDYSSLGLPAAFPQKDDFAAGLLLLSNTFHNNKAVINPDCQILIRTLEGGLLNRQRSDYERSDALGHCDAVAAAIYALRGVDKVTDLRPKPNREQIFRIEQPPKIINEIRGLGYERTK